MAPVIDALLLAILAVAPVATAASTFQVAREPAAPMTAAVSAVMGGNRLRGGTAFTASAAPWFRLAGALHLGPALIGESHQFTSAYGLIRHTLLGPELQVALRGGPDLPLTAYAGVGFVHSRDEAIGQRNWNNGAMDSTGAGRLRSAWQLEGTIAVAWRWACLSVRLDTDEALWIPDSNGATGQMMVAAPAGDRSVMVGALVDWGLPRQSAPTPPTGSP